MKVSRLLVALSAAALVFFACDSDDSGSDDPPSGPPGAPASLVAVAGDGEITLTWTASPGASSYTVYYGVAPGVLVATGSRATAAGAPHVLGGLLNGVTYRLVVTATGAGGESAASNEVTATPAGTFTQAALAGEWDVVQLSTNGAPRWFWTHARLNATGRLEVVETLDSDGATAPPPPGFDLRATVDATGNVRLAGADGSPSFRGSMAQSRALVFATDSETDPDDPAFSAKTFSVWRKRVPGVTYSAADLAGAAFALHSISAGPSVRWEYGAGAVDGAGVLTISEFRDSLGNTTPPGTIGTVAVDASGVVTMAGAPLVGVVAPDKNAVFVVHSSGDVGEQKDLVVMLRSGQTFVQADLAGAYAFQNVQSGASAATSMWLRGAFGVDPAGVVTFTAFENSAGATTLPASFPLVLSASGVLLRPGDASYHGQMSRGRDFYVRTSGTGTSPMFGVAVR